MKIATQSLFLACALAVSASCSGGAQSGSGGALANVSNDNSGDAPAREIGWAVAGKTAYLQTAFSLFDSEINSVVAVDLDAIVRSEVYGQYRSAIEGQIVSGGELEALKVVRDQCGFDPFTEIKNVVVGMVANERMEPDDTRTLVVVQGPARAVVMRCLTTLAKQDQGQVEEHGRFVKMTEPNGDVVWGAWLDDNTIAVATGLNRAELEKRLNQQHDPTTDNDLQNIVTERVAQTSSVWLAFRPPGGVQVPESALPRPEGASYKAMYAWIDVSTGVSMHGAVRMGDAQQASNMHEVLNGKLNEMKPMADMMGMGALVAKLKLETSAADVSLAFALSMADIQQIAALAAGM